MLVESTYNRPKIFFALVHTPSICFDQDRSNVSNRPKYLNVGTLWPLIVIVGGLFILFCLCEININLHLEGLRNMWLQFTQSCTLLASDCGCDIKKYHLHTKWYEFQERMDHWLHHQCKLETREDPKLSLVELLRPHANLQTFYHAPTTTLYLLYIRSLRNTDASIFRTCNTCFVDQFCYIE